MLNIDNKDGTTVKLAFFAATNIPAESSGPGVSAAGMMNRGMRAQVLEHACPLLTRVGTKDSFASFAFHLGCGAVPDLHSGRSRCWRPCGWCLWHCWILHRRLLPGWQLLLRLVSLVSWHFTLCLVVLACLCVATPACCFAHRMSAHSINALGMPP